MGMMKGVLCGLIFVIVNCVMESTTEDVIDLNIDSFRDLVENGNSELYLVEFYSPHCGVCQNFMTSWITVGEYLQGVVPVARLSTDESANRPLVEKYGVSGVPHIALFIRGNKEPFVYREQPRTPLNIVKWVLPYFKEPVINVESRNIGKYLCSGNSAEVYPDRFLLVYREMDVVPPLFLQLATKWKGKAIFANHRLPTDETWKEAKFPAEVEIHSFPAVVVLRSIHNIQYPGEQSRFLVYSGEEEVKLEELIGNAEVRVEVREKQMSGPGLFWILFASVVVLGIICVVCILANTKPTRSRHFV